MKNNKHFDKWCQRLNISQGEGLEFMMVFWSLLKATEEMCQRSNNKKSSNRKEGKRE